MAAAKAIRNATGSSAELPTAAGVRAQLYLLNSQVNEVPGASGLFVLAALAIIAGLVGMVIHLRREPDVAESHDEGPRQLNVYKKYDCPVSRELIDRFAQMEESLTAAVRGQGIAADWSAHAKLAAEAEAELKKGEGPAAFRTRCKSLLLLAEAFNKSRQKDETFKPNWRSPDSQGLVG